MKNVSFSSKYFQTCIILCNLCATCFYLPSNFDNYFCCSQLWRAGAANMEGRVTSWKELSLLFQPGFSLSPSWTLDFPFAIWIFAREVLRNRLEQLMENEKKEDRQLAQFRLIIIYCRIRTHGPWDGNQALSTIFILLLDREEKMCQLLDFNIRLAALHKQYRSS